MVRGLPPCAFAVSVLLCATIFAACAESSQTSVADELQVVAAGKADNYYSNVAAEYELTGTIGVEMTADIYADELLRARAIEGRLTAVGLYLTTFVTDKFRGIDSNNDGQISESEVFFHNEDYGGFHAMVRNYSLETETVTALGPDSYEVVFTIDVAGPRGMLAALSGSWDDAAQGQRFEMQMPASMTVSATSVPRSDIRRFDPAEYSGELETIELVARTLPQITNAYPHYAAFMQDGLYDITLFYGHDYNASRSDLREAEEAFLALGRLGFEAPVATFSDLRADSGPFVRSMVANGADVRVEVRIFHSEMFTSDRRGQHDLALAEVAKRDVFFYNGHAGPYYGFYLDAAGLAKVDYQEFATLAMDPTRQQLVIAQGCQTYSQYADMIYANPAKSEENLDVITTVNYSYGRGTLTILRNLLTLTGEEHTPVDFYAIVSDLNAEWLNSSRDVFYGVMGLDGDPQLHPYGDLGVLGASCAAASDCGNDGAYACVDPGDGVKQCGVKTLTELACPSGTRYVQLARSWTIVSGGCFVDATAGTEVFGVRNGSEAGNRILEFVNRATFEELDDLVGLDARAAKNIVAHRAGLDGAQGTADDEPIDTLEELDAIAYVGASAFERLAAYGTI